MEEEAPPPEEAEEPKPTLLELLNGNGGDDAHFRSVQSVVNHQIDRAMGHFRVFGNKGVASISASNEQFIFRK